MGLAKILSEPDGASIYGIWHLIVGFCSQQRLPRDGWLSLDGHYDGTPASPSDLALKFRRPVVEIERSMDVLSSSCVGWLQKVETPTDAQVTPDRRPSDAQVRLTDEGGRKEGRNGGTENDAQVPEFSAIEKWVVEAFKNGADYTVEEARSAYLSLKANGWKWGRNPVVDWRSAIECKIQDARSRKPKPNARRPVRGSNI